MRTIIILFFLSFLFNQKSFASIIKYEEILDNPTDLELNLNYAKQQEKNGNVKSTIATLERLSMLYPQNSDIKLYLLSILLKMDSEVKVNLMVKTMLNDPNTTQDTRDIIAGLLTNKKTEEKKEEKKWIAYLDLSYSQTEQDNISGVTRSGLISKSNNGKDTLIPGPLVDSRETVKYDKTYAKSSSITLGRIIDETSSLFMNYGLNINTFDKKLEGESDIQSGSVSYFKAYKNHYFSPYVYYNKANYRMQEDFQAKGFGINNTYLFNNKYNLNYALSYSDTRYHSRTSPVLPNGDQPLLEAGEDNNNEAFASSVRLNYNLSNKSQLSSKLILNDIKHADKFSSYTSGGLNLKFTRILPFGTFAASATHLTNIYDEKEESISLFRDRKDKSLVTNLSLSGNINQIFPFYRTLNKDNSIFYTLSIMESNVDSNIASYEIDRSFKTIKIMKRVNLND